MGAYASVAQLDRASDSDSEGRGFESRQMHHVGKPFVNISNGLLILFFKLSQHFSQQNQSIAVKASS